MGFYDDMAAMVSGLLAPDDAGGLGQGVVTLTRTTPGAENPAEPWDVPPGTTTTLALLAAVRGVSHVWVDGTAILATDLQAIIAVPGIDPVPGDRVTVDGRATTVVRVVAIPAAGAPVAMRLFLRG